MKIKITYLLFLFASCSKQHEPSEIESQMKWYGRSIKSNQSDSIASRYLPMGSLLGEGQKAIIGKDSISKFLKQFNDFHVLEYTFKIDSAILKGDTALLNGTYFQKVVIPKRDTLELGGDYSCVWIYVNGKWFINSFYTYHYKNLKRSKR